MSNYLLNNPTHLFTMWISILLITNDCVASARKEKSLFGCVTVADTDQGSFVNVQECSQFIFL